MKDYATSLVQVAPVPANTGTILYVQNGHGSRFPDAPFKATVHPLLSLPTLDNAEKVLVTAKDGDKFTIQRALSPTTAKYIQFGFRISNSLYAEDIAAISGKVASVNGKTGEVVLVKDDLGLGNVDNTSDANKPVSSAVQTALNAKANDSDVVKTTGNQTVAGIKTFTSRNVFANNNTDFGSTDVNRVSIGNLGTTDRVYFGSAGSAANIRAIYSAPKGTGSHEFNAPILLSSDPTLPFHAATKQYVDANKGSVTYTVALAGTNASYTAGATNAQVAINSAITAANSNGGGKVVVRKGSYNLSGKIVLKSNVTLEAEDNNVTLTRNASVNDAMFQNVDTSVSSTDTNIVVKGFKCVGNSATNASNSWAFNLNYVTDSLFTDNIITDCSAGFRCLGTQRCQFYGNKGTKAKDNSGFFGFQRGSNNNIVANNYCSEYTLAINLDGLLGPCNYNQIVGNTFENDYLAGSPINGDCILVINGSAHNIVANNTVNNYHEDGIRISDGANSNTVVGNTVTNIARWGITLAYDNTSNTVMGNTVDGAQIGILIDELGKSNTISGNTVINSLNDGITVNTNQNVDNIITGNTVLGGGRYGIYVAYTNNTVTNNYVKGNGSLTQGIYLLNASNCVVSNNTVKNVNQGGIRLQTTISGGTQNNIISGNRTYDDRATKVQINGIVEIPGTYSPDYNTYIGNNVTGNLTTNMSLTGANNEVALNMGY